MKKIIFGLLLLILPVLGFTQINEGFEGATFPPTTPGNWIVTDNGVGTVESWAETTILSQVNSGLKAAIMERENIGIGNTSQDWLISSQFTVPTNGQLRFFTRQTIVGNQGTTYEIRVSTNPIQNNLTAFTTVQTWDEVPGSLNVTYNVYEEKIVNLPTYAGQQVYLAFVKVNKQTTTAISGDRWIIDDVKVVEQCLNPTALNVSNLASVSANLNWTNVAGGATQYEVEVLANSATATGVGVPSTTATTYAATGLSPGTDYKFYVRAICASGVTSVWVGPFLFSTKPLGSICSSPIVINSLPFSESSNTNLYGDEVDIPQGPGCAGAGVNYLEGFEVFYSFTPTFSGNVNITMTPTNTSSSIFVYNGCNNVGVSCLAGVANTTTAPRVIPNFAITAGQTYVIVIATSTVTQSTPYSLVIQQVTCTPPVGLPTTNIGATTANLSWSNPTAATAWEVAVQPAGSIIPSGSGLPANTNTNFPVSGLTAGTAYQYWVRSDCGAGLFSPWAGPYLFNSNVCELTDQCVYTFRLTSSIGQWAGARMEVRQNGSVVATLGGQFTTGTSINIPVTLCQNYPFELFWTLGGTTPVRVGVSIINNFTQTLYTKAPGVGSSNTSLYNTAFNCSVAACLDPTAGAATAITTTTANLGWTSTGASLWDVYLVPNGSPAPTAATSPTYASVSTNPLAVNGLTQLTTYQYYVRVICSPTSNSNWAGPYIFTTLPTCPSPITLTTTALRDTSVSLGWTNVGPASAWQVLALPCGSSAPTPTTTGFVSAPTNPFTITGLSPGTCYDLYVRGVCSATDSSPWSIKKTITTQPGCGSMFLDNGNGTAGFYALNSDDIYTICPTNPGDLVTVTFSSFSTEDTYDGLYVFDGNSITSPQIASTNPAGNVVGGLAGSFWGTTIPGPFTASNASGCLTFRFRSDDSISEAGWVATVTCNPPPTCAKPISLGTNTITQTTANLTWTQPPNPGTATSWQVVVQQAILGPPTGSGITATNPYTATGLLPGNVYEFYVRANCGASDGFSAWAGPFNFSTLVANDECINAITVPVNDDALCTLTTVGSVVGATASFPDTNPACSGTANDDVWFKFTATATKHYITLFNVVGSSNDLNHALYSGSCGALTQLYCSTDPGGIQGSIANNLTIGNTYYIRVWTATASLNQTTTFNICVGIISTPATAIATCSDPLNPFIFANTTGVPTENAIACLLTIPNPTYYFMTVLTSGNMTFEINQNTAFDNNGNPTGTGLDVDFVLWGPYTSNTAAVGNLNQGCPLPANCPNNTTSPNFYPNGNIVDCSYSLNPVENFTINNAIAGQVYVFLITNYEGSPGFIKFTQTNQGQPGAGTTDCSVVCAVDLGLDQNLCGLSSSLLDSHLVNPIATYRWFKDNVEIVGETSQTYTATQSGTYKVIGKCGPNDVEDAMILNFGPSIVVPDQPDYKLCDDASNDGIASFNLATLTPNVLTGLNPNFTYNVSYHYTEANALANTNPINTSVPYMGTSQIIYIRVSAIGSPVCNTVVTQNLVVSPLPIASFNYSGLPYCQNAANPTPVFATGAVAGVFSATAGLIIDPTTGVVDLAASTAGTYTVTNTIAAAGACTSVVATANITITALPIGTFNYSQSPYCENTATATPTFTSGAVAGIFSATPAGLSIDANTGVVNIILSTVGTYEVTNSIAALNGCPDVVEKNTITINVLPIATINSSDPDNTICSNETATITVTPTNFAATAATYVWSLNGVPITGASTNIITPKATGNYQVVLNLNGCTLTFYQNFTVNVLPDFTLAGTNLVKCANEQAIISIVPSNFLVTDPALTYTWSLDGNTLPNTAPTINVTAYGIYSIQVNNLGCITTKQIEVKLDTTDIPITTNGACFGPNYIITASPTSGSFDPITVVYQWSDDNGIINGETQKTLNVTQYMVANNVSPNSFPRTFTVKITTIPEGCSDTQTFVVENPSCLIQKGISPNGDGQNDTFDLRGLSVKLLTIFNRYGTKIFSQENYTNEWSGQNSKSENSPVGTYYYVIDLNNGETKTGWIYINR